MYPHRVAIQEKTDATYSTPSAWSTVRNDWCKIGNPLSNRSMAELSAQSAEITREVRFRERPRVKIDQRLLWALHSHLVYAVNTGANQITVEGDFDDDFNQGDLIQITGSTGNDGYYNISSVSASGGNCIITTTESISDATADGKIKLLKIFRVVGVARDKGGAQRVRVKEEQ